MILAGNHVFCDFQSRFGQKKIMFFHRAYINTTSVSEDLQITYYFVFLRIIKSMTVLENYLLKTDNALSPFIYYPNLRSLVYIFIFWCDVCTWVFNTKIIWHLIQISLLVFEGMELCWNWWLMGIKGWGFDVIDNWWQALRGGVRLKL